MIYVTSDLHGYSMDSFLCFLKSTGFGDSDILYVLGDVIDRNGDGGIAMLRWMMSRPNVELVLGNHEAMLLGCSFLFEEITDENLERLDYTQMKLLMQWMRNGSEPTMKSLRALNESDSEALDDLLDYLREAPLYESVTAAGKDFLLVHSGWGNFDPGKKPSEYTPDEVLWHRPDPEERYFQNIMTILGHTPTGYRFGERGKMYQTDTWIDIDTGAAGGGTPMLLRLDDMTPFYMKTQRER